MEQKVKSPIEAFRDNESGKWGIINTKGKTVIPCLYDNCNFYFEHRVFLFNEDGRQVYKNRHGEIIPPHLWKAMNTFHEGLVTVVDESDHYGLADEEGNIVFPLKWDYAAYFLDGYVFVREGENRYYMDHDGKLLPILKELPYQIRPNYRHDFVDQAFLRKLTPPSSIQPEHDE